MKRVMPYFCAALSKIVPGTTPVQQPDPLCRTPPAGVRRTTSEPERARWQKCFVSGNSTWVIGRLVYGQHITTWTNRNFLNSRRSSCNRSLRNTPFLFQRSTVFFQLTTLLLCSVASASNRLIAGSPDHHSLAELRRNYLNPLKESTAPVIEFSSF
jgi:hypothetical protein